MFWEMTSLEVQCEDLIVIYHQLLLHSGSFLVNIDYSQKIGVIQFFMTHSLELSSNDGTNAIEKLKHVLAFVRWIEVRPDSNWFGQSAIVNIDIMELPDACCSRELLMFVLMHVFRSSLHLIVKLCLLLAPYH